MRRKYSKEQFLEVVKQYPSMRQAASALDISFNTFKRYATKFGIYVPNQGGAGTTKPKDEGKDRFFLADILAGKHPDYSSNRLKRRLIREGIKAAKCEKCGVEEWCGEPAPLELHHIDGCHTNHFIDNLQIVCCNCHGIIHAVAIRHRRPPATDEEIRKVLQEMGGNLRQTVLTLGYPETGSSYDRVRRVLISEML